MRLASIFSLLDESGLPRLAHQLWGNRQRQTVVWRHGERAAIDREPMIAAPPGV